VHSLMALSLVPGTLCQSACRMTLPTSADIVSRHSILEQNRSSKFDEDSSWRAPCKRNRQFVWNQAKVKTLFKRMARNTAEPFRECFLRSSVYIWCNLRASRERDFPSCVLSTQLSSCQPWITCQKAFVLAI